MLLALQHDTRIPSTTLRTKGAPGFQRLRLQLVGGGTKVACDIFRTFLVVDAECRLQGLRRTLDARTGARAQAGLRAPSRGPESIGRQPDRQEEEGELDCGADIGPEPRDFGFVARAEFVRLMNDPSRTGIECRRALYLAGFAQGYSPD
jgi:hypothetical protein